MLICDHGTPRNAVSRALHGYLTRDGIPPAELRRIGRAELLPYGIDVRDVKVQEVRCHADEFDVVLDNHERLATRTVLIATGVRDHLPPIDGLEACYGISVFHCPYCDGWEVRDQQLAVIGQRAAIHLALSLEDVERPRGPLLQRSTPCDSGTSSATRLGEDSGSRQHHRARRA